MGNNTFSYNYSAKQHSEVEEIRKKYLPFGEDKLAELKRLDFKAQSAGMLSSLCIGIISSLIFGIAFCMVLNVLAGGIAAAVFIGIIGVAGMLSAYPVYRYRSKKIKSELTPRILELAKELTI